MSSVIDLKEIPLNERTKIRKELTFKTLQKVYSNYPSSPPISFFLQKGEKLFLPYHYCKVNNLPIKNLNEKVKTSFIFNGEIRGNQISVVEEGKTILDNENTCSLFLPTAYGKTIVSIYLSSYLNLVTLVLLPRVTIMKGWINAYEKFTNAKIGIVGEKKYEPNENTDVILCMIGRVKKINKEILKRVGLLIIDESHMFCNKSSVEPILSIHPSKILIVTATFEKENNLHEMFISMVGEHCIKRKLERKFNIVKYELKEKIPVYKNEKGETDFSKIEKHINSSKIKTKLIGSICKSNKNESILILCKYQDHLISIENELKKNEIEYDTFYKNKKTYEEKSVLLGTIPKIGTGFDQSNFCDDFSGNYFSIVIIASSISSTPLLKQCIGRGLRQDNVVFFQFVENNEIVKRHWRKNKKWYDELKIPIQTIKL